MLNKRISSLAVTLLLTVCFAISAFAADATSNVSYTGKELQVKNGDISFSDLLPGTSRSQDIVLTNDSDKPADFYMDMRVLKALEDNAASGTVYTIGLKAVSYTHLNQQRLHLQRRGLYRVAQHPVRPYHQSYGSRPDDFG